MDTMTEVQVEELWTKTVKRTPIMSPTTGLFKRSFVAKTLPKKIHNFSFIKSLDWPRIGAWIPGQAISVLSFACLSGMFSKGHGKNWRFTSFSRLGKKLDVSSSRRTGNARELSNFVRSQTFRSKFVLSQIFVRCWKSAPGKFLEFKKRKLKSIYTIFSGANP